MGHPSVGHPNPNKIPENTLYIKNSIFFMLCKILTHS